MIEGFDYIAISDVVARDLAGATGGTGPRRAVDGRSAVPALAELVGPRAAVEHPL